MRTISLFVLLVSLAGGGAAIYDKYGTPNLVSPFRTAPVERGDLMITINATGTLEPEEVVDVGAQVVGRIKELGLDPRGETDPRFKNKRIDYGSQVEEGTVLAQIDRSVYQAQYNQAKAALERVKADLLQLQAKRDLTEAEWIRAEKLRNLKLTNLSPTGSKTSLRPPVPIKGISDSDYILAKANFDVAAANVEVGKSMIAQEQSALELTATNLSYTLIKSPVKGTIIDRRVNIGQTVVASLNAPSLFLIAKDLRRMQVWASVNEADIGRLKVDMPVSFSVDAFPNDVFRGQVAQIRLNATMTQNVVTYTVVISADNSDLKLLPYLTADVSFEVEQRKHVLLVPNAALRFKPQLQQIAPTDSAKYSGDSSAEQPGASTAPVSKTSPSTTEPAFGNGEWGTVWVPSGDFVTPIEVEIGVTDGAHTEVRSEALNEQLEVVVGENRVESASTEVNNPFAPPRFRGGKR